MRELQSEMKNKELHKLLREAQRQEQMLRANSASNKEAAAQLAATEAKVANYKRLLEVMCSASSIFPHAFFNQP